MFFRNEEDPVSRRVSGGYNFLIGIPVFWEFLGRGTMRVTAMQEYGLRCMLQLAAQKEGPLAVRFIAKREKLTPVYVEKILVHLRRAGLVKSLRGVKGGYVLARSPETISAADVLSALGQVDLGANLCSRFTGESSACTHAGGCSIRPIWGLLSHYIYNFMQKINIKQLLQEEDRVMRDIRKIEAHLPQSFSEDKEGSRVPAPV